jgi:hypothetical protein
MTPKQKALELYGKYMLSLQNDNYPEEPDDEKTAKECVLIAVNEVLKIAKPVDDFMRPFFTSSEDGVCYYWNEVKEEINKLP